MGLGSSTEQPAETSEGFHLHGVSGSGGAGHPGRASTPTLPTPHRRPEGRRARPRPRRAAGVQGEGPWVGAAGAGPPPHSRRPARPRPLSPGARPSASCAGSGSVSWSGLAPGVALFPGADCGSSGRDAVVHLGHIYGRPLCAPRSPCWAWGPGRRSWARGVGEPSGRQQLVAHGRTPRSSWGRKGFGAGGSVLTSQRKWQPEDFRFYSETWSRWEALSGRVTLLTYIFKN